MPPLWGVDCALGLSVIAQCPACGVLFSEGPEGPFLVRTHTMKNIVSSS